jgi:EAL domain-containing protein (putative c-di-GMP-specific phosphodiesterase class I)
VYLKQLPLDNLKVDRGFVCNIPADASDCAIASAVIGLASTLGLSSIAEGVETSEELSTLIELGIQKAQGFFLGRPLRLAELPEHALKSQPVAVIE